MFCTSKVCFTSVWREMVCCLKRSFRQPQARRGVIVSKVVEKVMNADELAIMLQRRNGSRATA